MKHYTGNDLRKLYEEVPPELQDRVRRTLSGLPEKFSFEKEVLEPMAAGGWLTGFVDDGYFIDIGIPEDYARAQRELIEFQAVRNADQRLPGGKGWTLLLDRDGVINRQIKGDYVREWAQFAFLPGVLETLRGWARRFDRVLVVTTQRGVGRGLMTSGDLEGSHARMRARWRRTILPGSPGPACSRRPGAISRKSIRRGQ